MPITVPSSDRGDGGLVVVLLLLYVALLGLVIGSFLNVVIHRVPLGLSVVSPPSRCPSCGSRIRARHNLPVLGWLLLRGRCAACGEPISARYPLVELLTGVAFVLVTWRALQLGQGSFVPALLVFTALGIALAGIDLDTRRLPNVLVLPAYPVLAVLVLAAAGLRDDWWAAARAGLGALALFGFFLALALAYPKGMGFGDVKLAGVLGLVLGYLSWSAVVIGAFAGFFLGAVVGVAVMATGAGGRKTALPFGPFMVLGALAALWIVDPVVDLLLPR
jgi:leader peptidase (prepilin peptidase) / N-methyltransferase